MRKAIEKNAQLLALFAVACTAIVGIINLITVDKIKAQEQQQLLKTLTSIIPSESYNNDLVQTCTLVNNTALGNSTQKAYLAKFNDQNVAAAITTIAPDGYNGKIQLLVAINVNGSVSGVRTLKHQETPGLGDKIEIRKNKWISTFNGKQILGEDDTRWGVKKDGGMFDQFTGATITPRAVVKAVHRTVSYFKQHHQALFQQPTNCQEGL